MKTDAQYADPFTGGSRYIPQSTANTTSQESTRPDTPNSSDTTAPSYIPHTKYLKLEQANLSQILGTFYYFYLIHFYNEINKLI